MLLGWTLLSSAVSVSGDDGVFHINRTSGVITLQTLPIFLKREIFNIKVRVSCSNMLIKCSHAVSDHPPMIRPQKWVHKANSWTTVSPPWWSVWWIWTTTRPRSTERRAHRACLSWPCTSIHQRERSCVGWKSTSTTLIRWADKHHQCHCHR